MTVKLLSSWKDQPAGTLYTTDATTEAAMVTAKVATSNLAGGVVWSPNVGDPNFGHGEPLFAARDPLTGGNNLVGPLSTLKLAAGVTDLTAGVGSKTTRLRIATKHAAACSQGGAQSNGTTQVSGTNRLAFDVNAEVQNLRFIFKNVVWAGPFMQNAPVGNALKFYACLERANNNIAIPFKSATGSPISSGGRTACVIPDGAYLMSEPTPSGPIAKGATLFYRVHKVVGAGEKWTMDAYSDWATLRSGGGYNKTTDFVVGSTVKDGTDQTATFSAQAWGDFVAGYFFSAAAILGEQITPTPVCLIAGDSIAGGLAVTFGQGYIGSALDAANIGYANAGVSSLAATWANSTGGGGHVMLAPYADHIISHVLTNDIHVAGNPLVSDLTTAKAALLAWAKSISLPTNKLWFSTMCPRTKTTDSWTSYGNQFFYLVANGAPQTTEPVRVLVNNFLRDTGPNGAVAYLNANLPNANVAGVYDSALAVERNPDGSALVLVGGQQTGTGTSTGGYWLVGATGDGIHPNSTGSTLMQPSVPVASFTLF